MLKIIIRTLIIYVILLAVMRIMGKRQLGELELSELITTLLLSEIATTPITNPDSPILHAIIPIAIIASLEVILSLIMLKCPPAKRILTSAPSIIIQRGKINKKEMRRSRISIDELVSQVRQNGVFDLSEVDYAILEENGKITIVPKGSCRPPAAKHLNITVSDSGVMHIIISDGKVNYYNLNLISRDAKWLESLLSKQGLKPQEIFCMTADDSQSIFIQTKEGKVITLQS